MSDLLYRKLADLNLLRRAWHLAIYDSRNDFIKDAFKYNDFAFKLDDNLLSISHAIKSGLYHPNPLAHIDVPKSTLSVRPGSVPSIEDRIVLFAITILIAPKLDNKLPKTVYSFRLKNRVDNRTLFKDLQILKFPFLKSKTIRRRVDIVEPWYGQWPKFMERSIFAHESEGYNYLTISDITSYFENVNIQLLHDTLIKYFSNDQKIVNLLCSILECWTWRSVHGLSIERGIPQGNDVSSFIGNIYLLPLDHAFQKFCAQKRTKYFRYMDDVKIFSKKEYIAREAVFLMNDVLRQLHLNIQGKKTMILEDMDIKHELIDTRLNATNMIIDDIQKCRDLLTKRKRFELTTKLKQQYKKITNKSKMIRDKDLRLYRRIITGYTLIQYPYMALIDNLLKQLSKNPDARLTASAVRYFRYLPRCSRIVKGLTQFLNSPINLFPYQEASLIEALRYSNDMQRAAIKYVRHCLFQRQRHWYVKVQSALLLANLKLHSRNLDRIYNLYKEESHVDIKRSLVSSLCQLSSFELKKFLRSLAFENNRKLFSIGRMLCLLLENENNAAAQEISNIFRHYDELSFIDNYYKIEVIKHCSNNTVRRMLLRRLKAIKQVIYRRFLKKRVDSTISYIEKQLI